MRILGIAAVAALVAGGAFSASAQTPSPCKGLAEAACAAPTCRWIKPTVTKKTGKPRKGYCRKATSARKKKTDAPAPAPKATTTPAPATRPAPTAPATTPAKPR